MFNSGEIAKKTWRRSLDSSKLKESSMTRSGGPSAEIDWWFPFGK